VVHTVFLMYASYVKGRGGRGAYTGGDVYATRRSRGLSFGLSGQVFWFLAWCPALFLTTLIPAEPPHPARYARLPLPFGGEGTRGTRAGDGGPIEVIIVKNSEGHHTRKALAGLLDVAARVR
jgi:hypothetical protein